MAQFEMFPTKHPACFRVITAATFLGNAQSLEAKPGVYGLLLRGAEPILAATSYAGPAPYRIGDFAHLYTGASFELGKRVPHHLTGTVAASSFRETLFAIDMYLDGVVGRKVVHCHKLSERLLTAWLLKNTLVAYRGCEGPADEETILLKRFASPFNIDKRRPDSYARMLTALRCAMNDKPIPSHCWEAAQGMFAGRILEGEAL